MDKVLADPAARRRITPSAAQQRLWFLHRAGLDQADYNSPVAFRFRGPLDVDAFHRALTALCARHQALGSRFVDVLGEPVVLASSEPPPLRFEDLRGTRHDGGVLDDEHWRRLVDQEAHQPFDLADGPLVRAMVVAVSADDFVVVITMHHAVVDGWSLGVVFSELAELYRAALAGAPPSLATPAFQYSDYVAWQDDLLAGDSLTSALAYWRERLSGAPVMLDLPSDRPRPPRSTRSILGGDTVTATLPEDVAHRLRAVARAVGATPFMAYCALYLATLSHYSGQQDIVVGVPYAGRDRPEFASVVGIFVNTIVLRADLSDDPTFTDLLGRVRRDALDAYRNATVPFDRLVDSLGVERVLDRNPVFQAFFTHQHAGDGEWVLGGTVGEPLTIKRRTTALDLDLNIQELPDGPVEIALTYATDLFDRVTAERVLRHLGRLAAAAAQAPATRLRDLPLLTGEERAALLRAKHPAAEPSVDRLHDVVERSAAENPDAVAVVRGDHRMTYRELDESANRLAWHLTFLGVGPEVGVGLCVSREPRLLVAILAILKAGGAYVPMESTLPDDRLSTLVADSQVPLVVTEGAHRHRLPDYQGVIVSLDEDAEAITANPAAAPPASAGPENLAYIMYTSGSTGQPKGVMVEHRHAVGLVEYYRRVLSPEEVAGVLASTPVGFDATIQEYFATLLLGGTVILVDSIFDLHSLPDPGVVTLVQGVPSLIQELLGNGPLPGGVTTIMLSGEPLSGELVEGLYASGSVKRLYNIYGVTEYTADSTWCLVERGTARPGMGEPLPGVRCYVLDPERRPVPAGARGELYLAGPGLSRGYFHRDDQTEQRYLPDPFTPGERMYRTGDLVRHRPDDQLEHLGRIDRQVKVNGCRVEPAEVESALREYPEIAQAAVVAHPTPAGGTRLAAYVVSTPDHSVPEDLRRSLARRLPGYMVPNTITALESFPLNPNGKLDVPALPAPELPTAAETRELPTPTEKRLLAIWRTVLDRQDIGVRDDFFALGGQSLLALRMAALTNQEFGVTLPVSALFEAPTVADLAELIDAGPNPHTGPALVELRSRGADPPIVAIHAVGGSVVSYAELSKALTTTRPVHAIEAEGLTGGTPLDTVPALATRYLDLLEAHGLTGPIILAGWSMGGAVAYEMTRQSHERVHSVESLILIDTILIDTTVAEPKAPADEAELAALYSQYLAAAAGSSETLSVAALHDTEPPLETLLTWVKSHGLVDPTMSIADLQRVFDVFTANMRALDTYHPTPLNVPTLYLAAREGNWPQRTKIFQRLLGKTLQIQLVDGDHHTMLRPPHVSTSAHAIDHWLSDPQH